MNDGNPQIEDGYTRIANELYDAILKHKFTMVETKLVLTIIRKTYGYQKQSDAISLAQFEAITKLSRGNCSRSISKLIKRNIIKKSGKYRKKYYSINKHYREWTDSGVVNLTTIEDGKTDSGVVNLTTIEDGKTDLGVVNLTTIEDGKTDSGVVNLTTNHCQSDNDYVVNLTTMLLSNQQPQKKERKKDNNKESHTFEKNECLTPIPKKADQYLTIDFETAEYFFSLIEKMNPGHKKPNLKTWAKNIRLHRERDGRTIAEIRELFEWANSDNFWQANILSPEKLRKKWDQLVIQKNRPNRITQKTEFKTVSEKYLDELRECGEAIDRRAIDRRARESQP